MKRLAEALFESVDSGIDSFAQKAVEELAAAQSGEERCAAVRDAMEGLVWYVFGRFDNVGCSLPEDVFGYVLLGMSCREDESGEVMPAPPEDIRSGEDDYSAMWHDYLFDKADEST